jgi:hypothetical protein
MNQENLLNELATLPPEAQQLVAEFITFLQTRYASTHSRSKSSQKALADEPFIGLWHNRQDMADSHAWVRKTREQEWGTHG